MKHNWKTQVFSMDCYQDINTWGDCWYKWGCNVREDIITLEILLRKCCKLNDADFDEARKQATEQIKRERTGDNDPQEPPEKPWK